MKSTATPSDGDAESPRSRFQCYWPKGHPQAGEPAFAKVRLGGATKNKYRYEPNKPRGADDLWYIATDGKDLPPANEPLYLTEGERDADAIHALGQHAISHHQGAGKATLGQASQLRGRTAMTYIVCDRDVPGYRCGLRRYGLLVKVGIPDNLIAILLPKPTGKAADVRDHIIAGFGLDELVQVTPAKLRRELKKSEASSSPTKATTSGQRMPRTLQDFDGFTVGDRPLPGQEWKTFCPVCEDPPSEHKTPSASLNVDADGDGKWKCFSCGSSGGVWPTDSDAETADAALAAEVRKEQRRRDVRRTVDAMEADRYRVVLPRQSMADLLSAPRPPRPPARVEGIHRVGHNTTVTAQYKTGKTTFLANLLRSLADGRDFLGAFGVSVPEGRIGFLNYELAEEDFLDWIEALKVQHPERVAVANLREVRFSLAGVANREELAAWCRDQDVEVLVLDPHRRAFSGIGSENSNDDVNLFTEYLDEIKRASGVKDLFLSVHTGRESAEVGAERARGATALDDWADNRIVLGRADDTKDPTRFCRIEAGRTANETREFRLQFDSVSHDLVTDFGTRMTHRADRYRDKVLATLTKAGSEGRNVTSLEAACEVTKNGALKPTIATLVEEGLVVQVLGPRNAKFTYLAEFAPTEVAK